MTVNIGIIGTGMIGTTHARRLTSSIAGSRVTAVTDVDTARAAAVADEVGAQAVSDPKELVRRDDVDAVLIATPGFSHPEYVLDTLTTGKPIFCEKPLATTIEDAEAVVRAEAELGKRLIQVGFMRRFDPGYREVKDAIDSGTIGTPLLAHMIHRNAQPGPGFGDAEVMNDSLSHEVDAARFLFGEEIVAVNHYTARTTPNAPEGLHDPSILVMEMESGGIVIAEAFMASTFAYEVRCEVVGSSGTAELTNPRVSRITTVGKTSESIELDWEARFADTYRIEVQAWVDSLLAGGPAVGPSAWDGYAVTLVTATALQCAANGGARTPIEMMEKPSLYV